jgi:hypothetical protein
MTALACGVVSACGETVPAADVIVTLDSLETRVPDLPLASAAAPHDTSTR